MNVRDAWRVLWRGLPPPPPLPDATVAYEVTPEGITVKVEYRGVVSGVIDGRRYWSHNGVFVIQVPIEVVGVRDGTE